MNLVAVLCVLKCLYILTLFLEWDTCMHSVVGPVTKIVLGEMSFIYYKYELLMCN